MSILFIQMCDIINFTDNNMEFPMDNGPFGLNTSIISYEELLKPATILLAKKMNMEWILKDVVHIEYDQATGYGEIERQAMEIEQHILQTACTVIFKVNYMKDLNTLKQHSFFKDLEKNNKRTYHYYMHILSSIVEKNNYINQLNNCYEHEYNDYEEDEYGEDLPVEDDYDDDEDYEEDKDEVDYNDLYDFSDEE